MPAVRSQPSFSLRKAQPSRAMKMGVVATIQAVVVAWEVCRPGDCSH